MFSNLLIFFCFYFFTISTATFLHYSYACLSIVYLSLTPECPTFYFAILTSVYMSAIFSIYFYFLNDPKYTWSFITYHYFYSDSTLSFTSPIRFYFNDHKCYLPSKRYMNKYETFWNRNRSPFPSNLRLISRSVWFEDQLNDPSRAPVYLSIYLCTCLSIYLHICLSIYFYLCLFISLLFHITIPPIPPFIIQFPYSIFHDPFSLFPFIPSPKFPFNKFVFCLGNWKGLTSDRCADAVSITMILLILLSM